MKKALVFAIFCKLSASGIAQTPVALDTNGKLLYHAEQAFGPAAMGSAGIRAGFLQLIDSPTEWGQGGGGYGKRFASSVAISGVRGVLAFGLDATLRHDPRYHPSVSRGWRRRTAHALRGTVLTHKDNGGQTLAIGRLGSAYGAAFISNQWYPSRMNTVGGGLARGTLQIGLDCANNLRAEFWPDIRRKISRRKP